MAIIRSIIIFFLLAISFSTIAQTKIKIVLPDSNIVFKKKNNEGVIFGKNFRISSMFRNIDMSKIWLDPLKVLINDTTATRFVPLVDNVIKINSELKHFVKDSDSFISTNLQKYTKQYFGYITSKGDSIIYINSFYDDEIKNEKEDEEDWRNSWLRAYDGGHYYFSIKYNVTKKKFFDLSINAG